MYRKDQIVRRLCCWFQSVCVWYDNLEILYYQQQISTTGPSFCLSNDKPTHERVSYTLVTFLYIHKIYSLYYYYYIFLL